MITFNALDLIPTIAAFRGEVVANRAACKSAFALELHDTLLTKLDQVAEALLEEVETEKQFAADKGTWAGDFLYEIYHVCTHFERRWIKSGTISILDEISERVVIEDDAFDVDLDYTIAPAAEQEGLADILDRIRQQTGIRFVAARV
ncbi:hypothetical protein [Shinella zoogloeoides]|uniref:hypothetical protein n=1 Tax=Shinella zoogloeoides TaxID=352475 RepID=UPI0028AA12E4|nr:hypothetical protein [Shinella zoogloeoides]